MGVFNTAAARRAGLLAAVLLVSGCEVSKEIRLTLAKEAVLTECFGQYTNRCNAKNINFNILLLKSSTPENWIPFEDVRTREQMVELFGPEGWTMFEESVNAVLSKVIEHFKEIRPGWFTRTVLAERQPREGLRAFLNAEDVQPIRDEIQKEFTRRLKAAGWQPTAETQARFGAPTGGVRPGAGASPSAAPAIEPPSSAPAGWQAIQQQITSDPEGYVRGCMERYLESAQQLGGMSREEALEQQPDLEGSCRQERVDLQNCMKLDPAAGERCYEAFTQNAE